MEDVTRIHMESEEGYFFVALGCVRAHHCSTAKGV